MITPVTLFSSQHKKDNTYRNYLPMHVYNVNVALNVFLVGCHIGRNRKQVFALKAVGVFH